MNFEQISVSKFWSNLNNKQKQTNLWPNFSFKIVESQQQVSVTDRKSKTMIGLWSVNKLYKLWLRMSLSTNYAVFFLNIVHKAVI